MKNKILTLCIASMILATCRTIKRYTDDQVVKDISGDWNDRDYRDTSSELSHKLVSHPWMDIFIGRENRPPKIIVGYIKNKTSEIDLTDVLRNMGNNLEKELLKTGKVIVSGMHTLNKDAITEGLTPEMRAAIIEESSADFILVGEITSLEDKYKSRMVRTYMISLSLIELKSGNTVAIVDKDNIRKYIKGN